MSQQNSFLKRKMDAKFASTNSSSAVWADLTKLFTNSSQKGLLLCTSNSQVHLSVFISVLCLIVILTVVLFQI
jgi:hypothetical protein